jgi:peptidoglycan/LPS O-acetylase OafA/YrhL
MRKNNFDIVRLLLAVTVVLVHSEDLSGSPALAIWRHILNSHLAVEGFFVISGFLIFASYERCTTLKEYFANRAWRILPGYWLSTVICLLIAFAHRSFHVGRFLFANLTFANFLQPNIPGVFASNPGNTAMNGALWTIKIEVMFYIAVPFIVWLCRRLNRDAVLWFLMLLSIIYRQALTTTHESLSQQLPGQLSFFMAGTLIYYHLEGFKRHGLWLMAGAAALYGVHVWTGFYAVRPVAVGILVLGVCLLLPQVKGPTRWGDFSYGTYILHWPVLQLVIEAGLFRANPWGAEALALSIIGVAAVLSWNFIEKPSLAHAKSRRLRQAALGAGANYPAAVP